METQAGRLVPPGDPLVLAEAVVNLLEDEPARVKLGRAARLLAQERYSWEGIAERLSEIYEGIVESQRAFAA
jgi:glycosyltransferase involved in cell wall biosynthesis